MTRCEAFAKWPRRLAAVWLAFGLLAGCGGAARPATLPSLERLRAAAQRAPRDGAAWRALAFAEASYPSGDGERLRVALRRALALRPNDARLHWLAGLEAHGHGRTAEALEHWLTTLEQAAEPPGDPTAALAALAGLQMSLPLHTEALLVARPRLAALLAPERARQLGSARFEVARRLLDWSLAAGDRDGAEAAAAQAGCPGRWRLAGPFGWLPKQDFFSGELPPDRHPERPLADRYEVNPVMGERPTLELQVPLCEVRAPQRWSRPGAWYAETTVRVERAGPVAFYVVAPRPYALYVDGRKVGEVRALERPVGRVRLHVDRLRAGTHRVRLAMVSRQAPAFTLAWQPAEGIDHEVEGLASADAAGGLPGEGPLLRTAVLLAQASGHHARRYVEDWRQRLGGLGPMAAWLASMAWRQDALAGRKEAHDAARELLRKAAVEDPTLWPAQVAVAATLAEQGQPLQALALLEEALQRLPGHPALRARRIDLLMGRGWLQEALEAAKRLADDAPGSRLARQPLLALATRMRRTGLRLRAARAFVRLAATHTALLDALMAARRFQEAEAELRRLQRLTAGPPQPGLQQRAVELAMLRQAPTEELLGRLAERREPEPPLLEDVVMGLDVRLAGRGVPALRGALGEALGERAFDEVGRQRLRETLRALGAETDLDRWRFDALAVLRDYRARAEAGELPEAFREAPQVLLFDGMTTRLYETGAMLRFTHQIYLLQSEEAVDGFGELRVPDGALLLTARTLRPDGERLEPDRIAGKDSLSFPRLRPGDAVEFEYVQFEAPSEVFPRGADSGFFYFSSFETPFYHSELRFVAPADVDRLVFEERAGAPERQARTLPGGLREVRWVAREMLPLPREPLAPPVVQWVPAVRWAARPVSWAQVAASLYERLLGQDVADPRHVVLARRVAGEGSASARARRLFAWVREHVEPGSDALGPAAPMLADRRGHPARLFHYVARLAGLQVGLLLASDDTRPADEPLVPDASDYPHLLLRLRLEDGRDLVFYPPERYVPFGWLPPSLSGARARSLQPPFERLRLPEQPPAAGSLEAEEATVEVGADGSATIEGEQRFEGQAALQVRSALSGRSRAQLEQVLARMLPGQWYPGAELLDWSFEHMEAAERPLVLRYRLRVPSLLRAASAGGAVLPPPAPLAGGLAQSVALPERVSPLMWRSYGRQERSVRFLLPEGARAVELPEPVALQRGPVAIRFEVTRERPGVLRLHRVVEGRPGRVAPRDYPAFARAVRRALEGLRGQVVLQTRR